MSLKSYRQTRLWPKTLGQFKPFPAPLRREPARKKSRVDSALSLAQFPVLSVFLYMLRRWVLE
ncbi:hypothetical protein PISMIDRAFT_690266 [Pisolithus microcarpus 441]|uniref:Uncharacterized protein n=1 Tax=Pisolithus microcarpus 441 TaxID=765257 RepID=A0A0C9YUN8_9AGAM|nr:hypothetical protein PISMIDRAFT_690266 [Pisolithus microcarpus 441]